MACLRFVLGVMLARSYINSFFGKHQGFPLRVIRSQTETENNCLEENNYIHFKHTPCYGK